MNRQSQLAGDHSLFMSGGGWQKKGGGLRGIFDRKRGSPKNIGSEGTSNCRSDAWSCVYVYISGGGVYYFLEFM